MAVFRRGLCRECPIAMILFSLNYILKKETKPDHLGDDDDEEMLD